MSPDKKDFFGKTVADAVKQACDALHLPQEELTIEVIETGSTGIFGFIRKKAHIRAACKPVAPDEVTEEETAPIKMDGSSAKAPASPTNPSPVDQNESPPAPLVAPNTSAASATEDDEDDTDAAGPEEPLSEEGIQCVKDELSRLLELMGIPSQIEIEAQGSSLRCHIIGEFQDDLCGQEGKTLDSLQYLLRKIATRKVTERIRISIDVGDYREKRQDELQELALQLAVLVKEDGKTQVIPSLNPSERRVVHMALQEDKEIRSRSVGDGLFKKVLIYKPGSKPGTSGPGRKRPQSRGKRGRGGKPGPTDSNGNSSPGENE